MTEQPRSVEPLSAAEWRHAQRCEDERGRGPCNCGLADYRAARESAGAGLDVERAAIEAVLYDYLGGEVGSHDRGQITNAILRVLAAAHLPAAEGSEE